MSDSQKANKSTTGNVKNGDDSSNNTPSIVVANFTNNNTNVKVETKEAATVSSVATASAMGDDAVATKQNSVITTSGNLGDAPGAVGIHAPKSNDPQLQSQPQQPSSYHLPYPTNAHVQHPYTGPPTLPHGHMNMTYSQPPPSLHGASSMTYHQMPPLSGTGSGRGGISPNGRPGSSPSSGTVGEYVHHLPPPSLSMNGRPMAAVPPPPAEAVGSYHHHHRPAGATGTTSGVGHLHPQVMPPQATWQAYPMASNISVPISGKPTPKPKYLTTPPEKFLNLSDEQVSKLISDSTLVTMQDRKFVPDFLFISIAQLELSHLTHEDQIGVYRDRKIGQIGLCCRHCKGSPGNGRYFPETVRSLGQSTTSATIAKHMSEKCPMIPIDIKNIIKQLKYEQDWMDQLVKKKMTDRYESRPKYGSRKLFFNNVWKRLTGEDNDATK
jgi:hypothetical protein